MLIYILVAAVIIAVYVAYRKHKTTAAVVASAQKEAAIVKADVKAAISKADATAATIKADLAKYL